MLFDRVLKLSFEKTRLFLNYSKPLRRIPSRSPCSALSASVSESRCCRYATDSMAFQTNVFRDGEWVTQTIDLQAVLKANTTASSKPPRQRLGKPPDCGILTRTIVESPAVRWILPCRLRSETYIDVAFVGVSRHTQAPNSCHGSFIHLYPQLQSATDRAFT